MEAQHWNCTLILRNNTEKIDLAYAVNIRFKEKPAINFLRFEDALLELKFGKVITREGWPTSREGWFRRKGLSVNKSDLLETLTVQDLLSDDWFILL